MVCYIVSFSFSWPSGYFDNGEPYGEVGPGALVVHSKTYARLSNISDEGTWVKDESFKVGGKLIARKKGDSAGKIMRSWRLLRRDKPEWFKKVQVYQQPSGFVDGVIQSWMIEDLAESVGPAVWQRDCFAAAFTASSRQSMFAGHQIPCTIAPKMTASLQLTDTDFAKSFKAAARLESEAIQMEERRKAKAENRRPDSKMGVEAMMQITVKAQEALEKANEDKRWVLAGMRRNFMLSYRPDLDKQQMVKSSEQAWAAEFPEGTSRLKSSWYEDRYQHLTETGAARPPEWKLIDGASDIADLVEWDYCEGKRLEDDEFVLEIDELEDGLQHHALDAQLFQLSPDLRRAALKLDLKMKSGDARAVMLKERQVKRQRRIELKRLKALEDPVWKQRLRLQLKNMSRREVLAAIVPAAGKPKAKAKSKAKAKAKSSGAIADGSSKMKQSMVAKMKNKLKDINKSLKKLKDKPADADAAADAAAPPPPPPEVPEGHLKGKVLRVVDEAAGVLHFGAQGKALRHLVESGTVHL